MIKRRIRKFEKQKNELKDILEVDFANIKFLKKKSNERSADKQSKQSDVLNDICLEISKNYYTLDINKYSYSGLMKEIKALKALAHGVGETSGIIDKSLSPRLTYKEIKEQCRLIDKKTSVLYKKLNRYKQMPPAKQLSPERKNRFFRFFRKSKN